MANETMQWPNPGLGSVGSYQMGGIPYASASITVPTNVGPVLKIQFPYVTKFVTVVNEGVAPAPAIRVGFSALGTTGSAGGGTNNYFVLDIGQSYTAEMKVSKVFLLGHTVATSASVIAGLTGIETGSLQQNWSGSIGVG